MKKTLKITTVFSVLILLFLNMKHQGTRTLADFGIHLNRHGAVVAPIPANITYVDLNHDGIRDVVVQAETSLQIYKGRIGSLPPEPDLTIELQHSIQSVQSAYCHKNCVYPDLYINFTNGQTETWKNIWEKRFFARSFNKNVSPRLSAANEIDFNEVWRSREFAGGAAYMWAGDIDNDGVMEIAVQTFPNGDADYDVATIHVFKSTGDNSFREVWNTTGDFGALDLKFGDVDGNGRKEIIIANGRTVKLWESVGVDSFRFYETDAVFKDPSIELSFRTREIAVTDINQDGVMEITRLHSASGQVQGPNTIITIDEFVSKDTEQNFMAFNRIYTLTDQPFDADFAAGDIDNDGGNEILIGGAFAFDLTYLDYDPVTGIFTSKDIITGIHSTGKNPRIFDFDQDGLNEILEPGGNPLSQRGSLFMLKSTASDSFKVIWRDSTSRFGDSLTMEVGSLKGFPAAVVASQVLLNGLVDMVEADAFLFEPGNFRHIWTSARYDSSFIRSILVLDMDRDGKDDIVFSLSGPVHHVILDFESDLVDDVSQPSEIPTDFELLQNYPNPFNPETTIVYDVSSRQPVNLTIYNIRGEAVITLVNALREAGRYSVIWDGKDSFGHTVSSGVYLYRLRAGANSEIRKMIFLQ